MVTQFVTSAGAAPGEAGELVILPPRPNADPTIAAAGDISCNNVACHDDEVSNLMVADPPTRVLTLGDNQYEHGELENFQAFYEPDWGRLKSITMPTPGNHDPPSSGYGAYFGKPANYSYELGAWHLIALDSTGIAGAAAFLEADLARHANRCILAYWHHPRFSSGAVHGNDARLGPLWDLLYAAGGDVVLSGHDHLYERFAPQTPTAQASPTGIRQFVVGTGGKGKLLVRNGAGKQRDASRGPPRRTPSNAPPRLVRMALPGRGRSDVRLRRKHMLLEPLTKCP